MAFAPFIAFIFRIAINLNFIWSFGALGSLLCILNFFFRKDFHLPRYIIPGIIVFVYYMIWDMVNGNMAARNGFFIYLYKNVYFHLLLALILIDNTTFIDKIIKNIYVVFKITLVSALIITLFQVFYDPFFFSPESTFDAYYGRDIFNIRLNSVFSYIDRNEVGWSMIPILTLTITHSIKKDDKLLYLWIASAGMAAFASNSRWVWLNFFISCGLLILYKHKSVKLLIVFIPLILILFYFTLVLAGFNINQYVQDRLLSDSALSRFLAWDMFKQFFPHNPFFGSGEHRPDDLVRALRGRSAQIHVGYLSHMFVYGIVGSIFAFYFWFVVLKRFITSAKFTGYYGSLFAFICYLVANLTLVEYTFYRYGMIMAFVMDKYYRDKFEEDPNMDIFQHY